MKRDRNKISPLLTQQIGNDPNAMVSRANVVAADGGPAADLREPIAGRPGDYMLS